MPDYSHCVIYRIINKETGENLYVGSTTNYNSRMSEHKTYCKNFPIHVRNRKIYQHIRSLGGWKFVDMIMVEEYRECQNDLQKRKKEREYIDELKPLYNTIMPFTTKEEKSKRYRIDECNKLSYIKKKAEAEA